MSLEHEFLKIAAEIAENFEASATRLESEIAKVEAQAEQIKAKRDLARSAANRLANFEVTFGGYVQCPACWIERGLRSPLQPTPSSTPDDIFRCSDCQRVFSVRNKPF